MLLLTLARHPQQATTTEQVTNLLGFLPRAPLILNTGTELEIIITNALFVPDCPMNLLSPQQVAQQTARDGDGFHAQAGGGMLTVGGRTRYVPYSATSRLPILHTASTIMPPDGPTACMSAYVPYGWGVPLTLTEQKALTQELSKDGGMASVLRTAPPSGTEYESLAGVQPNLTRRYSNCCYGYIIGSVTHPSVSSND